MSIARTIDGHDCAILVHPDGTVVTGTGTGGGGGATSVWSAADAATGGMTLSNGGLTVTAPVSGTVWNCLRATSSHVSGKVYVEFALNSGDNYYVSMGLADANFNITDNFLGSTQYSFGENTNYGSVAKSGFIGLDSSRLVVNAIPGDIMSLAVDFNAGRAWIAYNNVWSDAGDPVAGANPLITNFFPVVVGMPLFPCLGIRPQTQTTVWTLQATAASQKYAPPSGFKAWDGGTAPPPTSVWSASDAAANGMTLSNGGLTANITAASLHNAWQILRGSISKTSGQLYVEFSTSTGMTTTLHMGLASSGVNINSYLGDSNYSVGINIIAGAIFVSAGFAPQANPEQYTIGPNDVLAIAIDLAAGNIWVAHNNIWNSTGVPGDEINPTAGVNPIVTFTPATVGALFPAMAFSTSGSNGVWTLQSTAASQKYAPPSGFSAWDSAAPTHSAEALAYLARTVGGNEGGNGANIATLIDGLVSDGVWAKLDALYVLAQQNQSDALLNLVGTNYGLVLLGTANFAAYKGFSAFTSALDTGLNPSTAIGVHFTLNNASFGAWCYDAPDVSTIQMGTGSGVGGTALGLSYGEGTQYYAYIAYASALSVTIAPPGTPGLYVADKSSSVGSDSYHNAVFLQNDGYGTAPFLNVDMYIGGASGYSSTQHTISAAFIGASLGAAGQLALYNRLRTYMTAVGVP